VRHSRRDRGKSQKPSLAEAYFGLELSDARDISNMAIEQTFAIIKPDAVAAGHAGQILSMIEKAGFRIRGMKMTRLSKQQAEGFYDIHRERPFFSGLVTFMTEGPVVLLALEREDAIKQWRELMGATNPEKAAEGTIRKKFAHNIERNAVHGSDAPETAAIEIPFFFSMAELL
jgi:nucleoside-diphosphate kinase